MRNANIDKLVMLLSTDWVFPHWAAVQIELSETAKSFIQQGCRTIVEGFIGGAEQYYLVSFAQERLAETKRQFFALLADAGAPQMAIQKFVDLIAPEYDAGSRWMVTMTTKMLVTGHQDLPTDGTFPVLDASTVSALTEWHKRQPERVDFGQICLGSTTAWDKYIGFLTPRSPASLESYLQVGLITELQFRDLRTTIAKLTDPQSERLRDWYAAISRKLTRADETGERISAALSG